MTNKDIVQQRYRHVSGTGKTHHLSVLNRKLGKLLTEHGRHYQTPSMPKVLMLSKHLSQSQHEIALDNGCFLTKLDMARIESVVQDGKEANDIITKQIVANLFHLLQQRCRWLVNVAPRHTGDAG